MLSKDVVYPPSRRTSLSCASGIQWDTSIHIQVFECIRNHCCQLFAFDVEAQARYSCLFLLLFQMIAFEIQPAIPLSFETDTLRGFITECNRLASILKRILSSKCRRNVANDSRALFIIFSALHSYILFLGCTYSSQVVLHPTTDWC